MYRKKFIKSLSAAAVFIGLIVFIRPFSGRTGIYVEKFWLDKINSSDKFDIVLAGDSRMLMDISPEHMASILTRCRIYNFAFEFTAFENEYLRFIENKLDPASNKKTIVLGISPLALTNQAIKNSQYLNWQKKQLSNFEKFKIRYFGKILKAFQPINHKVLFRIMQGESKDFIYYREYRPDGWVASDMIPPQIENSIKMYREHYHRNPVDGRLVENLINRIRLWRKKGISVYGFRPPVPQRMRYMEGMLGKFNEKSFVLLFKKAGGIWLDINTEQYESYDASHLKEKEAIRLSIYIAEKLKMEN